MAYTKELAAKLTGASPAQLSRFRTRGVLVPEYADGREMLYSFRDIVALRTVMSIRGDFSLQAIRKALRNLEALQLQPGHLSEVRIATSGKTILVEGDEGFTDILKEPGARELTLTLEDIFRPFKTFRGREVPDMNSPAPNLTIDRDVMGGIPVIEGTRIPFDTVADLVDFKTIFPEDVPNYFPSVTPEAAQHAVDFAESLRPKKAAA